MPESIYEQIKPYVYPSLKVQLDSMPVFAQNFATFLGIDLKDPGVQVRLYNIKPLPEETMTVGMAARAYVDRLNADLRFHGY